MNGRLGIMNFLQFIVIPFLTVLMGIEINLKKNPDFLNRKLESSGLIGLVASIQKITGSLVAAQSENLTDASCKCGNGKVKLWGPGGPHTALLPAQELFNKQQEDGQEIELCWGPEANWRAEAKVFFDNDKD